MVSFYIILSVKLGLRARVTRGSLGSQPLVLVLPYPFESDNLVVLAM